MRSRGHRAAVERGGDAAVHNALGLHFGDIHPKLDNVTIVEQCWATFLAAATQPMAVDKCAIT